jgi:hypothetical protein
MGRIGSLAAKPALSQSPKLAALALAHSGFTPAPGALLVVE